MNSLRKALLTAYTAVATPFRHARLNSLAAQSQCPISVLFYHRVANSQPNGWTINQREFTRHIDYCQTHFELLDLAEVQRRIRDHDSGTPAVSITFDDGYRDNCEFALPMLMERNIPCTYFVSTQHVIGQIPFAHDVAQGQTLAVNTPQDLRRLADAGVEMGCHTRSHVDFSKVHDFKMVRREIVDAKQELEQIIGQAVRYFAFPFGLPAQLTQAAIEVIHEAGFDGFCSAFGGYNLVGRDSFHIRRCHADPEFARLKNWLTFDRRKSAREPSIRYFLPPHTTFAKSGDGMPRISPLH